ncbi:hypothetical protein Ciccas_004523 [Cichlidogyrus casuarinus]|uniref:Uncharacterized protein n=1 Tax=Cichlidogyrus casuarinus TaxID=1844966 RepID=A0ABD2QBA1_9PLAT
MSGQNNLGEEIDAFLSSKSENVWKKVEEATKSALNLNAKEASKSISNSKIYTIFSSFFPGLQPELQNLILNFFESLHEQEIVFTKFQDDSLKSLISCAKTNDDVLSANCLRVLALALNSRKDFSNQLMEELESDLPYFFHRKIAEDCVVAATRVLAAVIAILPLNKLEWIETPFLYCLQHVSEKILCAAFDAAVKYTAKGCDAISKFIQEGYLEMVYCQLRFPSVKIKLNLFKVFTNIALCCQKHRHTLRQHDIIERLPAYICHYDDDVCMQAINFLDAMQFSQKEMIERKYVVTLILHVSMSPIAFKNRCFDMLRNIFVKCNDKEVIELVDSGFIRPFCSMLAESDTDRAREILELLLQVVENYNGLEHKLCRFDFDHAHNSDNKSCVDQIHAVLSRSDAELVRLASRLLDHLKAKDIKMHAPTENAE